MFTTDARIDRRILLEASSLEAAGFSVVIVSPSGEIRGRIAETAPNADRNGANLTDSPAVPRGNLSAAILRSYRQLRSLLQALGIDAGILRSLFWRIQRRPDRYYRRLFGDSIRHLSARVYVAHDLPMLPVAVAAALKNGGKVVYDSHELYPDQEFSVSEQDMWRRLEERYIRQANLVITINDSIAHEMARRYGIKTPAVIRNCDLIPSQGVDEDDDYLRHHFCLDPETKLILFHGGLLPNRNLENLVRALKCVGDARVVLVILGDGPMAGSLRRLIEDLGLGGRVLMHAAVPQERLISVVRSADAGTIPYQANNLNMLYCTPNKLFELIAARVPVLASDLPEIRKIVTSYGIGSVGDMSTPERIAELLAGFLDDGNLKAKLRSGLEAAAQDLSWEKEGERLVREYRNLLREPAQA